jgi:hypothetical protein
VGEVIVTGDGWVAKHMLLRLEADAHLSFENELLSVTALKSSKKEQLPGKLSTKTNFHLSRFVSP